ncbi:MAG: hypothetical protein Ct9H300mP13_4860 [Gammaproteobacteria bacterium]|nr:MAG: hypothetical protein Ct9H300mP13_4860 [Gammaproteobacteria bacterium]
MLIPRTDKATTISVVWLGRCVVNPAVGAKPEIPGGSRVIVRVSPLFVRRVFSGRAENSGGWKSLGF